MFQIKQSDREEIVQDYLKNIWKLWKLPIDNYNVDPHY